MTTLVIKNGGLHTSPQTATVVLFKAQSESLTGIINTAILVRICLPHLAVEFLQ